MERIAPQDMDFIERKVGAALQRPISQHPCSRRWFEGQIAARHSSSARRYPGKPYWCRELLETDLFFGPVIQDWCQTFDVVKAGKGF